VFWERDDCGRAGEPDDSLLSGAQLSERSTQARIVDKDKRQRCRNSYGVVYVFLAVGFNPLDTVRKSVQ
jgi:hypothetical protein